MSGIAIRAARLDECEAILQLWRDAQTLPTVTDNLTSVRRVVADHNPNATLLIAEVAGERAGTVIAGWDGWRGTLYRLAVLPQHRRRGVARALVAAAVAWHEGKGAQRIVTFTHLDEPQAIAFWRSLRDMGFEETDGDARFVRNL